VHENPIHVNVCIAAPRTTCASFVPRTVPTYWPFQGSCRCDVVHGKPWRTLTKVQLAPFSALSNDVGRASRAEFSSAYFLVRIHFLSSRFFLTMSMISSLLGKPSASGGYTTYDLFLMMVARFCGVPATTTVRNTGNDR